MGKEPSLSEEVRQFVVDRLDSVAELEGLLLMRAEPVPWTPSQVARRLYVDDRAAEEVLHALVQHELVVRDEALSFRYEPASEHLRQDADALAESYRQFLIPITHLIHAKAPASLRQFADAFRLRGDT